MGYRVIGLAALLGIAADAQAQQLKVLPGEWETTTTMVMKTMPNMPPQVAAMLQKRSGKPVVIRTCITPEEAARGPVNDSPDKNCKMNKVSYGLGRMSAESVCNHDGDITHMKMTGSYTPTSYTMDGAMEGSRTRGGPMAMTMHMTGRRIAAVCSPGSK